MKIGILGGMGPEATNRLANLITQNTPAQKDQDHIPVITYNNPLIPDRTDFILGRGLNPLPELIKTAQMLEQAGASFILMPCNTSHFFLPELSNHINIPILNMIKEVMNHIVTETPNVKKVGILATDGTLATGLYKRIGAQFGIKIIYPEKEDQNKVMKAIYQIKNNDIEDRDIIRSSLESVSRNLVSSGAESIIAGCTEISLMLPKDIETSEYHDPLKIIARRAISIALKQEMMLI